MDRREFAKSVASITAFAPVLPTTSTEDEQEEESGYEPDWNMRATWRRRDDKGYLDVIDGIEREYESYEEWGSDTMDTVAETGNPHVVNMFDFRLISVYDGGYYRSHFAHDCGLEVTIKQEPEKEAQFRAFVRDVGDTWDEARIYASDAQIAIADRVYREREKYL